MMNLTMADFSTQLESIALTYATDTIFILGKGQSADFVKPELFTDSLVIGVNDAERIAPADITVFHASWVQRGLADSGSPSANGESEPQQTRLISVTKSTLANSRLPTGSLWVAG